jgi:hypothetical protein
MNDHQWGALDKVSVHRGFLTPDQTQIKMLEARITELEEELDDYKRGAQVEADDGDEARRDLKLAQGVANHTIDVLMRNQPVMNAARNLKNGGVLSKEWYSLVTAVMTAVEELERQEKNVA